MATKKKTARKRTGGKTNDASKEIREEMIDRKKSGRSAKQAIAIGLSRARRKGKDVPAPKKDTTSAATRKKAESDIKAGRKKKAATKKKTTRTASKKTARKSTKKAAKKV